MQDQPPPFFQPKDIQGQYSSQMQTQGSNLQSPNGQGYPYLNQQQNNNIGPVYQQQPQQQQIQTGSNQLQYQDPLSSSQQYQYPPEQQQNLQQYQQQQQFQPQNQQVPYNPPQQQQQTSQFQTPNTTQNIYQPQTQNQQYVSNQFIPQQQYLPLQQQLQSTQMPLPIMNPKQLPPPPAEIFCGKDNLNSEHFDDYTLLAQHQFPHHINEIKLQITKQYISGVQVIYEDGSGKQVKGNDTMQFFTLFKGLTTHDFKIPLNDYIQVVHGTFTDSLTSIGFLTYQGRSITVGQETGQKFSYQFIGHTFTCLRGSTAVGNKLKFLAFKVVKLPFKFVQSNFPDMLHILYPPPPQQLVQPRQQTIIVESVPQNQYQQQPQRSGGGAGRGVAMGVVGTLAAIETVHMLERHHHNEHRGFGGHHHHRH